MRQALVGAILALSVIALQACQVRPLYYSGTGVSTNLAAIEVEEVDDRVSQELRNRLIFLYSGGKGEPANPEYSLDFQVDGVASEALREQLANEIAAQRYTATVTYTLTDIRSKEVVGSGKRTVVTFYDQTTQEFANRRALRDAENRAAKELAEIVRADTASLLSQRGV